MGKVESMGRREGINKLAEAIKTRGEKATATPSATSNVSVQVTPASPDYVLETKSLKDRAQTLIDSEQFSGKDLDFLMEVVANKED